MTDTTHTPTTNHDETVETPAVPATPHEPEADPLDLLEKVIEGVEEEISPNPED